jgi:hypothetical protein
VSISAFLVRRLCKSRTGPATQELDFMRDLRYAFRSLSRARGFAIAVVLTLGLGIGANTAIFSVVRGVLLKPLPHRDGERLVYLRQSIDGPGGENILLRPRDPRLP